MSELDQLAERFEEQRVRLRSIAYRMLGSFSEAEDAVQETWIRTSRTDVAGVDNLAGWLTTVLARVCLNLLRSRRTRGEQELDETHVPDFLVRQLDAADPEREAELGESVGLAMLVVLDRLAPTERLAFVLHDIFGVPFDDIAEIVESTPAAARQLASRARRRVQDAPAPDADLDRQREAVDAFFAAARDGDFEALVAILDPDVVLRADGGAKRASATALIRGAANLATQARGFADGAPDAQLALVNGALGAVIARSGRPLAIMGFVVRDGRIAEINILADPERMSRLDLSPWLGE